jgi:hypothetical protein
MALANYGDLKTSVANWLGRQELTSYIPDYVAICHAWLMRELRNHPRMIKRDTAFSVDAEYESAPSDFMELVAIYRQDGDKIPLTYLPHDTQGYYFQGVSGEPKYVTIVGNTTAGTEQFRFGPPPNGTYTMTLEYYARVTFFANDSATNWILTDHPDLYLYGSLLQATAFIKDDARIQLWQSAFTAALDSLKKQGARARWGANSLSARAA